MSTHREEHPEQYSHPIVGHKVRITTHVGEVACGVVERVVQTRFGTLVHLDNGDPNTAWSINNAKIIDTKYKVKLTAEVKISAYVEIKMEGESEDQIYENAVEEYKRIVKEYEAQMSAYRRGELKTWPECPYYWYINDDDIENTLDDDDIEVHHVEEVKE